MRHEEELLSALIDGELTAEETARVEGHLKACAGCAAELAALRHMKAVMAAAPRRAMPADLVAAIELRVQRPAPLARLRGFFAQPRVWAPASALALAAALMSVWVRTLDRAPDQYVPLEPLLAAHSRYAAESLVPEDNLVAASYSAPDASADQDSE